MLLATQVTRDTILDMGTGRKHFLSAEQFGIVSLSPSNNPGRRYSHLTDEETET